MRLHGTDGERHNKGTPSVLLETLTDLPVYDMTCCLSLLYHQGFHNSSGPPGVHAPSIVHCVDIQPAAGLSKQGTYQKSFS